MKTKTRNLHGVGGFLGAGTLAACLLLGANVTYAAKLEKQGDLATGISNLTIGSNVYDVAFSCNQSTVLS